MCVHKCEKVHFTAIPFCWDHLPRTSERLGLDRQTDKEKETWLVDMPLALERMSFISTLVSCARVTEPSSQTPSSCVQNNRGIGQPEPGSVWLVGEGEGERERERERERDIEVHRQREWEGA